MNGEIDVFKLMRSSERLVWPRSDVRDRRLQPCAIAAWATANRRWRAHRRNDAAALAAIGRHLIRTVRREDLLGTTSACGRSYSLMLTVGERVEALSALA